MKINKRFAYVNNMNSLYWSVICIILLSLLLVPAKAGITYGYDETGRLESATWDDGTAITYVYDDVGNFVTRTVILSTGTPTPTTTPACLHNGDVNGSGSLSAADAQMAFNYVLGMVTLTYEEECAADCDGSGTVTAADAQAIFLEVLGMGSGCVDKK